MTNRDIFICSWEDYAHASGRSVEISIDGSSYLDIHLFCVPKQCKLKLGIITNSGIYKVAKFCTKLILRLIVFTKTIRQRAGNALKISARQFFNSLI